MNERISKRAEEIPLLLEHEAAEIIGKKIRQLRKVNYLTQTELASLLGVRFQQVQKYESGENRISAGRLFLVAEIFGVNVNVFSPYGEGSEHSNGTLSLGDMDDQRLSLHAAVQSIPEGDPLLVPLTNFIKDISSRRNNS